MRKSKREKDKEAAEAKKRSVTPKESTLLTSLTFSLFGREEEHEAARAYAEFVDAFDADGASRSRRGAFVKAGGREEVYTPAHRELKERDEHTERVCIDVKFLMLPVRFTLNL